MVPTLAPHFRIVALDLPGHGAAPSPQGPFAAEDILSAVREYVDAHDVRGCYCLGHSLGGVMAAMLQLDRPGTFRAMFLFEPVMRPYERLQPSGPGTPGCGAGPGAAAPPEPARGGGAGAEREVGRAGGGGGGGVGGSGASGCGPSPSLAAPRPGPDSLLARIARKRQAVFPSVDAAKAALGSKPPFSTFHPQALHAYLACGGLRPVGAGRSASAAATAPPGASTRDTGSPAGSTATTAAATDGSAGGVALSCDPETEARVYEALDPPPWRPWHRLTAAVEGCCAAAAGPGSGPGPVGPRPIDPGPVGPRPIDPGPVGPCPDGCRVAFAVGRSNDGIHGRLAAWTAELASVVPGAKLNRFPDLQHLGPMEAPDRVARAALEFFLGGPGGLGGGGDGGAGCSDGSGNAGCSGVAGPAVSAPAGLQRGTASGAAEGKARVAAADGPNRLSDVRASELRSRM